MLNCKCNGGIRRMSDISRYKTILGLAWKSMCAKVNEIYNGSYTCSFPVLRIIKSRVCLTCFAVKLDGNNKCVGKQPSMLIYSDFESLEGVQICEFPLSLTKLDLPPYQVKGSAYNIEDALFDNLAHIKYNYRGSWSKLVIDMYDAYLKVLLKVVTEPYIDIYIATSSAITDLTTGKYVLVDSEVSKGWLVC